MAPNPTTAEALFWDLIDELREHDDRIEEGTIMGGRCARVAGELLGLVDYKGSGMVIKLPRPRVDELIDQGDGLPFAPAGKVFGEWVAIPKPDRRRWTKLPPRSNRFRCAAQRHDHQAHCWLATHARAAARRFGSWPYDCVRGFSRSVRLAR
jgi:hypothetical protein